MVQAFRGGLSIFFDFGVQRLIMIKELEKYILDNRKNFKGDVSLPLLYAFLGEKPVKNKVVFVYSGNSFNPFAVGKISRRISQNEVHDEYGKVEEYKSVFPKEISKLLPKPLGKTIIHGTQVALYDAITESSSAFWFLGFPKPHLREPVKRFAESALDTLLKIQTVAAKVVPLRRLENGYSAAFYHGDFIPVNIFYSVKGVTHVIDWEDSKKSHIPLQDFFFFVINLSENALGRSLIERDFTDGGWVCDFEEFAVPILAKHMAAFNVRQEYLPALIEKLLDEIIEREDDGLERVVSKRYESYRGLLREGRFYQRLIDRCGSL